jgi:hypothetical protein
MVLSPFLCDGVVEFAGSPPLSFGHLPQIRQVKFGLRIEYLNRRFGGDLVTGFYLQMKTVSWAGCPRDRFCCRLF